MYHIVNIVYSSTNRRVRVHVCVCLCKCMWCVCTICERTPCCGTMLWCACQILSSFLKINQPCSAASPRPADICGPWDGEQVMTPDPWGEVTVSGLCSPNIFPLTSCDYPDHLLPAPLQTTGTSQTEGTTHLRVKLKGPFKNTCMFFIAFTNQWSSYSPPG